MTIPGSASSMLMVAAAAAPPAGYQIERSLRFNSSDSAYLSKNFGSASNRRTWTWAGWVKLSSVTTAPSLFMCRNGGGDSGVSDFIINSDGTVVFTGAANTFFTTTQVLRDFSAWYHLVLSVDTTAATAGNRIRFYLNGSQVTTFNNSYNPTQNFELAINQAAVHNIGGKPALTEFFNGLLADVHFIDSQALTPSAFGEFDTNGVWQPIDASGLTYGTNGFHLPFSDNSTAAALGTDTSSNGNTWTVNNLSVTAGAGNDSLVDSPTNGSQTDTGVGGEVVGNYCTVNPLQSVVSAVLSNGNLDGRVNSYSRQTMIGSIFQSTGKWYAECTVTLSSDGLGHIIGIVGPDFKVAALEYVGNNAASYSYKYDGQKFNNASGVSYGSSYGLNDVIGIAMDLDGGTLTFYKNGVSQGQAYSGLTGLKAFAASLGGDSPAYECVWNFGQRQWAYAAPAGFKALCTANLPEPTIADGSTAMDVKLYTGNDSTQTISGLNFSPDFVWLKSRSQNSSHCLLDTVRGRAGTLNSDNIAAEYTASPADRDLVSFDSTGFTLGQNYNNVTNTSPSTYVAWTWDAGSSTVSNTEGSITSQVRANPSAGFSIVTATCASGTNSYGHGLGVKPSMYIVKNRDVSQNWQIWHQALSNETTAYLQFNTSAQQQYSTMWAPSTSTTISLVSDGPIVSGDDFVAYCFAPVAGYSSFGSYTGNGSADGPFVYTGFRPRWVMWKNASYLGSWYIHDTSRSASNVTENGLFPNIPDAENSTYTDLDILSNGFKQRTAASNSNASGNTYIYAAFAEHPFQSSRAR